MNNLVGKNVFVLGNNFEEPIRVGVFKGFGVHHLPIVEISGKEHLSCGMLIPYSERLYHMMRDVPKKELWEMFKEMKLFWETLDAVMIGD